MRSFCPSYCQLVNKCGKQASALVFVTKSCLAHCDPRDCSLPGSSVHGVFLGKNSGVGCHFLLQGIFLTQGSSPHFPHWQADSLPPATREAGASVCGRIISHCLPVFLARESHGQKSLVGYSPWGLKESDTTERLGFSGGANGKESACQCRRQMRRGFDSWVRKIPWSRKWQPTPGFLPGKFHGQKSLEGYSPWDSKESGLNDWTQPVICLLLDKGPLWGQMFDRQPLQGSWAPPLEWIVCACVLSPLSGQHSAFTAVGSGSVPGHREKKRASCCKSMCILGS